MKVMDEVRLNMSTSGQQTVVTFRQDLYAKVLMLAYHHFDKIGF